MAIPNRRQFLCPENITFPTSENFFFVSFKVPFFFVSSLINWSSKVVLSPRISNLSDLIWQFLRLLFFFFFFFFLSSKVFALAGLFRIHISFESSAGLVTVSTFDVLFYFPLPNVQVKVRLCPEMVAVIQAGFFFLSEKEVCVYVCRRKKKVLGLTSPVQILSLSSKVFQYIQTEVSLRRLLLPRSLARSLALSLLCS